MCGSLPHVYAALAAGELGVAQFDLLGRVYANPRVRLLMVDAQDWFIERATMAEIFDHYISAERLADWQKARAQHGDAATESHLGRTESQRRADAMWKIFEDATSADGTAVPADFCHDIVWGAEAFEAMVAAMDPDDPATLDDADLDPDGAERAGSPDRPAKPSSYRRNDVVGPDAECPPANAKSTTQSITLKADQPTPETGDPAAEDTTDGNKKASPSGATPPANGTSTDPTEPKSSDRLEVVGALGSAEGGRRPGSRNS